MNSSRIVLVFLVLAISPIVAAKSLSENGVTLETVNGNRSSEIILSFEPMSMDATALSFAIDYPSRYTAIDTSDCLSQMPKHLSGGCKEVDGAVKVIIYNPANEPIGPVVLGTVSLGSSAERSMGSQSSERRRAIQQSRGNVRTESRAALTASSEFRIHSVDIGSVQSVK